jgi:hypothetical protein
MLPILGTGTGSLIVPVSAQKDVSFTVLLDNFALLHCLKRLPVSFAVPTCSFLSAARCEIAGGGGMLMLAAGASRSCNWYA